MPILIYKDDHGHTKEHTFSDEVSLGSGENCNFVLPEDAQVAPWHAVIIRSALTRVPILVNLAGEQTWVNNRPVIDIQVLRQRDHIQLGQAHLTMWEIRIIALPERHRAIGRNCQVCLTPFEAGDEVVECPRCRTLHHRDCWFSLKKCANYACDYSVYANILNALAPKVTFHGYLGADSELVEVKEDEKVKQEGKHCPAGEPMDLVPFQVGDQVVYCPSLSCRTPYHLSCWLKLEKCKVCEYDIRELLDQLFSTSSDGRLEVGSMYDR